MYGLVVVGCVVLVLANGRDQHDATASFLARKTGIGASGGDVVDRLLRRQRDGSRLRMAVRASHQGEEGSELSELADAPGPRRPLTSVGAGDGDDTSGATDEDEFSEQEAASDTDRDTDEDQLSESEGGASPAANGAPPLPGVSPRSADGDSDDTSGGSPTASDPETPRTQEAAADANIQAQGFDDAATEVREGMMKSVQGLEEKVRSGHNDVEQLAMSLASYHEAIGNAAKHIQGVEPFKEHVKDTLRGLADNEDARTASIKIDVRDHAYDGGMDVDSFSLFEDD